jgi:hypothetical protein
MFKARFVPLIEAGQKRQTIRAPRTGKSRHARPGEDIQCYTGSRFKPQLIARRVCVDVDRVRIDIGGDFIVRYRGLTDQVKAEFGEELELNHFASVDGFENWEDMRAFWRDVHKVTGVWDGALIAWRMP